jgi:hypothetical protein
LSIPTSIFGRPLEFLIVDPALKWGGGTLRSPMIVPDSAGVNHIMLGIGAQNYPAFPDWFMESKKYGVSKRVPRGFPVERLTPGKSRFLLTHPRAIPREPFRAGRFPCPKEKKEHEHPRNDQKCVGGLWPLAGLIEGPKAKHEVLPGDQEGKFVVKTPSVEYSVPICTEPDEMTYDAGVLMQFSLFQFELVDSKMRGLPEEIKRRYDSAGFKLECVPE